MKRAKVFLLFIFMGIISMSCEQQKANVTVGFLMDTFSAARWAMDQKYFEEKVKSLGADLILKIGDGSDANQFVLADEMFQEGIDVLVIVAANVNTAAAIVRDAHAEKIKVIAYDRLIRNSELDYFVGFDAQQIGNLQAEYALSKKPRGNYVLLEGDYSDLNAVNFEIGQRTILDPKIKAGDINILYRVFVDNWSSVEATHEIEKVIKLSDEKIDVILSANDGNAMGARNALNNLNIDDDILITGLDAELLACRRIVNDEQTMTVYTPIIESAETAAELAVMLARDEKLNFQFSMRDNGRVSVPSIILNAIAVDKSNINRVIEDGLYTEEEIYSESNL